MWIILSSQNHEALQQVATISIILVKITCLGYLVAQSIIIPSMIQLIQGYIFGGQIIENNPSILSNFPKYFISLQYLTIRFIIEKSDIVIVIMSKKQHISVGARVRPLSTEETHSQQDCLSVENNCITIALTHKLKHFDLPIVFDRHSPQQEIFQIFMLPLVQDLFQGYSCAFLSCGQNKSGKSYTVNGGESEQTKGLIPRLIDFLSLKFSSEGEGNIYMMKLSYIEIYEEEIIDLLGIRKRVNLQISEKGREIQLKGVEMKHIKKINQIENCWIIGNRKRQLAYSKKHRNPAKSTSIFTLYLQSVTKKEGNQEIRKGKLHIVDMAASRYSNRYEFSSPLAHKQDYNLSLNALKNVSLALVYGKNNAAVPYKDSKVTILLRQHLGGYGKTSVLFHLVPTVKQYSITIDSLRLAKLVTQIQNQTFCQVDPINITIIQRIQQLAELRNQLDQVQSQLNFYNQQKMKDVEKIGSENEFLSQSMLYQRKLQQLRDKTSALLSQKIKLKRLIENLSSLFVNQPFAQSKHHQFRMKYKEPFLKRVKDASNIVKSLGSSAQFYPHQHHETGVRDKSRAFKQQIFDLQLQFQQEREMLLQKIRKLEGEYKFYERVSLQTVKKEQIDILRGSSRYDSTKRSYQVPDFAIREKKLSLAQRFIASQHKSMSKRKFLISKSISERQGSLAKRREQQFRNLMQIKKINTMSRQQELTARNQNQKKAKLNTEYFPQAKLIKESKQNNKTTLEGEANRPKINQKILSSTRFKFK